jgi:hypothetical protein
VRKGRIEMRVQLQERLQAEGRWNEFVDLPADQGRHDDELMLQPRIALAGYSWGRP